MQCYVLNIDLFRGGDENGHMGVFTDIVIYFFFFFILFERAKKLLNGTDLFHGGVENGHVDGFDEYRRRT